MTETALHKNNAPPPPDEIGGRLACALLRDFGDHAHKFKRLAKATGASTRTVEGWFYEGRTIQTPYLIPLMAISDEVFEEVCRMAGRPVPQPAAVAGRNNHRLDLPHMPAHVREAVNGLLDAIARDDGPVNENMAPVRYASQGDLFDG